MVIERTLVVVVVYFSLKAKIANNIAVNNRLTDVSISQQYNDLY
jgi:hypothetical protein